MYVVCLRDTTDRKRNELLSAGERRLFERLAANVDLSITLEAITDLVERVAPGTLAGAAKIADSLRQAIRDYHFEWQDRAMDIGVSIGIVEMNGGVESITVAMRAADVRSTTIVFWNS